MIRLPITILVVLGILGFCSTFSEAQDDFDMAALKEETRQLVIKWDQNYQNGILLKSDEIIEYISSLEFLDRYDDALLVLTEEINSKRLEMTADRSEKSAYYLRRLNRSDEAIPFLRKAIELGHPTAQIQLTESLINTQKLSGDKRDCEMIELESGKAVKVGWSQGKANLFIANCYFDRASFEMISKCPVDAKFKLPDSVKAELKRSKAFLKKIPKGAPEFQTAKKWQALYKDKHLLTKNLCK